MTPFGGSFYYEGVTPCFFCDEKRLRMRRVFMKKIQVTFLVDDDYLEENQLTVEDELGWLSESSFEVKDIQILEENYIPDSRKRIVPNKVYSLLNVPHEDESNEWSGGMYRFKNVPYDNMALVFKTMGDNLSMAGSDFTPEELLVSLEHLSDTTTFNGYVIGPSREDTRVTIEGVETEGTLEIVEMLASADTLECKEVKRLYAWWD